MEKAFSRSFLYLPPTAILVSIILHLLFLLSLVVIQLMDGWEFSFFPFKRNKKELSQSFIQVDIVALPDSRLDETKVIDSAKPIVEKPTEAKPEVSEPAANDDSLILENKKKREAELKKIEKIKKEEQKKAREAALKSLQNEVEREQALKSLEGRVVMKGNKLSKGTSMAGNIGNESERYYALILATITSKFNVFPWQSKKNLTTVASFRIGSDGRIVNGQVNILQPSVDPTYDSAVKKAILDAQPFPKPEEEAFLDEDFTIEFKP